MDQSNTAQVKPSTTFNTELQYLNEETNLVMLSQLPILPEILKNLNLMRRVLAYRILTHLSCSARYFAHSSYSTTDFRVQHEGNCNIRNVNDKSDGFRKVGSGFQGELSFGASVNYNVEDEGDDDDEVGEEEGSSDDESLELIGSFRGNHKQRENIARVEIDENEFRHPLVKEVCRLITLRSAWNPKLEGQLRHLLRSLKPPHVCAILRSQVDERVALNFFYWADRQWRYKHNTIVYYTLLDVLSKTKLCQGARRILRLMTRRGIECPPEVFGYVMVSYSRAGKLRNALRILTLMQKAGVEPNLSICNTAIYVLVKGNKLEKSLRFLERMRITGIEPDIVTYNCLIKGYCDLHRSEDGLKLIAEMPSKGCLPDKVSYYTVMVYFCKEKKIEEVMQLMKSMVSDSTLIPDQVTYNTLIHTLSKHGHADDALNFLREAEDKGFHIDKIGYSAIVHSFCKEGRMEEAKSLVNNMYSRGCIPDVVTYTAIINGFCRTRKIDEAKKMLQQMYKHGCKPNTVSYTALLNGLCHNEKSLEAREMINVSEEHWWTPNAITYSVVMHGLRREGKLSEACELVREMVEKGFFPTPVEINQLIQSLCRNKEVVEAKLFLQECLNKGCAVNVVNFTTVIHGFCQTDDLEAALSMLDDMYLSNKHPDAVTYTALADALGKKGRLDMASELIVKMLSKGLDPTPVTYRTVVHRHCQWGRVDDMLKLLKKMLARQPFGTVYNQVIEKLCAFGNLEEADKLLGEVLRTASKVDANTCHVLMESHLTKGAAMSAYKVACRMFSRNLIPDLKLCEKIIWYGAWKKRSKKEKVQLTSTLKSMLTNISSMAVLTEHSFLEAYAGESIEGSSTAKFSTGDIISMNSAIIASSNPDDLNDLCYAVLALFPCRFAKMEGITAGLCLKGQSIPRVVCIHVWKSLHSCYSWILSSDHRKWMMPYLERFSTHMKYDIFRVVYVNGDSVANLNYVPQSSSDVGK
ncbi:hypothetical protein TanjilG_11383 [Lupinus angustifolius]|uniref:DUF7392 domain-containing protein n=1 Tax=Lupinus angustifolius TaxID=3871 RepID=A0A1J7HMG4_LUPAN|nr:hypothetical protein TanjilG_11383 [Lupinus angustifolius]